ncbi:hypothetical protein GGF32_007607 [Allomyces javanicus]|nr:hypothetical protein GGF32_007607 [Allomyces javanicus]
MLAHSLPTPPATPRRASPATSSSRIDAHWTAVKPVAAARHATIKKRAPSSSSPRKVATPLRRRVLEDAARQHLPPPVADLEPEPEVVIQIAPPPVPSPSFRMPRVWVQVPLPPSPSTAAPAVPAPLATTTRDLLPAATARAAEPAAQTDSDDEDDEDDDDARGPPLVDDGSDDDFSDADDDDDLNDEDEPAEPVPPQLRRIFRARNAPQRYLDRERDRLRDWLAVRVDVLARTQRKMAAKKVAPKARARARLAKCRRLLAVLDDEDAWC